MIRSLARENFEITRKNKFSILPNLLFLKLNEKIFTYIQLSMKLEFFSLAVLGP